MAKNGVLGRTPESFLFLLSNQRCPYETPAGAGARPVLGVGVLGAGAVNGADTACPPAFPLNRWSTNSQSNF